MEAIILAGGLGTRLKSKVKDVPKPMAIVNGRPFLEYILTHLQRGGVTKAVISVGFMNKVISDHFRYRFGTIDIEYSVEDAPLGTGGGILQSLKFVNTNPILVVNGDTYFQIDIFKLLAVHSAKDADVTIAAKFLEDPDRYGTVKFDKTGSLVSFEEKVKGKAGFINGGIYLINKDILLSASLPPVFSFEIDFLNKRSGDINIQIMPSDDYFIDIGTSDDFEIAQREMGAFL
ncbi:D-glycero-D-manno-heptose 1-phosphate guanosyltransferase [Candidatus Marinimicrobia bacterium MT.SAG.2]|nr:D-glycero-D-manno-heptose 1-phosphate guanosyltransferase [Candidatus Marinimicrobia bacterium MT.SAG.2]